MARSERRAVAGRSSPLPMREFAYSLPMALLRAREMVMRRFRPMLAEHGITEQQWRVLRSLEDLGPTEVSRLARHCCILLPSMLGILKRLEARGWAEQARSTADQRSSIVTITPAALDLIKAVAPEAEQNYAEIERRFGKENTIKLYGLLFELADALEGRPNSGAGKQGRAVGSRPSRSQR